MLADLEKESHLPIQDMQGHMVAGMVFPANANLNQFQTAAIGHFCQPCNRLRADLLTSWFRWNLNQSNKTGRSKLQRNPKCYSPVWVMPNPLQLGFNRKCFSLSWPPHYHSGQCTTTTVQKLIPQPLLSLLLPKLLLYISYFQCPVGTKPESLKGRIAQ